MISGKETLIKIAFTYALSKLTVEQIDSIVNNELTKKEKVNALIILDDERIAAILSKIGFKEFFLESIKEESNQNNINL